MNRAQKFNRSMMLGTLVLGILVIGLVAGMLYYAFTAQGKQPQPVENDSTITVVLDTIASQAH
jgi:flagellar basal body-associated protein FliL